MDFEMVRVREDVTLEVVLRYLRRLHELPDHTDQIFGGRSPGQAAGHPAIVAHCWLSEPETGRCAT